MKCFHFSDTFDIQQNGGEYMGQDNMFPTVDYSKLNQREQVVAYMKEFGSISSLEGFRDLGISRVPNRISELRQRGYIIEGKDEESLNRWRKPVSFKRYRLVKEPDETKSSGACSV